MPTLVDRLERRFGRLAIPNLTLLLIAGQATLYLADYLPGGVSLEAIELNPHKVLQGEFWRLLSFPFSPPGGMPIFALFYFSLFYMFGSAIEHSWGAFRYNLFLWSGLLANVVAAFVAWAVLRASADQAGAAAGAAAATVATNSFMYGSIFLAFAQLNPNYTLNIYFLFPVPIRFLAILTWIGYTLQLLGGTWMSQLLVLATIFNYLLFFGRDHWRQFKHARRKQLFQAEARQALKPARHVCRVCGLSSDQSPRTLFRYCSKCEGQACYCPEHIREHEHVATVQAAT
jgi:hypothetical protein